MSASFESWDGESPEIVELDLSGTQPKPAEVLRQAPRVRFLLDEDADDPHDDDGDPPPPAEPGEYRSGLLVLLAYTLGPFTPLVMRQGRHNLTWALVALVSVTGWGALLWRWPDVRDRVAQGIVPLLPFAFTLCSVTLLGIAAWSRAIFLAGKDPRFVPERLPRWLRRPAALAGFGLLAPGLGHLASGHPRRAATVFWIAATTALPILTLVRASWLWRCNRNAGTVSIPDLALEGVFLACAALAAVGVILWIGSALDGLRLRSVRNHGRSELRGDWLAATLLVAILTLVSTLQPVKLAHDLDQFAGAMRYAGFRVIPLTFESAATHLDPAEPKYRMQVAELLESIGKKKAAQGIRERMRERWSTYAEHLLREELHEGEELLPIPIGISEGDSTSGDPTSVPGPEAP